MAFCQLGELEPMTFPYLARQHNWLPLLTEGEYIYAFWFNVAKLYLWVLLLPETSSLPALLGQRIIFLMYTSENTKRKIFIEWIPDFAIFSPRVRKVTPIDDLTSTTFECLNCRRIFKTQKGPIVFFIHPKFPWLAVFPFSTLFPFLPLSLPTFLFLSHCLSLSLLSRTTDSSLRCCLQDLSLFLSRYDDGLIFSYPCPRVES